MSNKKKARGKAFVSGDPRINRAGVPKASVDAAQKVKAAIEAVLHEKHKSNEPDPRKQMTRLKAILRTAAERAAAGSDADREFLFKRWIGHVPQPVELGGKDGKPIPVSFTWDISAGSNASGDPPSR